MLDVGWGQPSPEGKRDGEKGNGVGRTMASPKDVRLVSGTCEYVSLTWKRIIKVADEITLANQLTLK